MRELAMQGSRLSAADYVDALGSVRHVERQLSLAFETYDLIVTPSAAACCHGRPSAFPNEIAGQEVGPRGHAVFTAFVNLVGAAGIVFAVRPIEVGAADRVTVGLVPAPMAC